MRAIIYFILVLVISFIISLNQMRFFSLSDINMLLTIVGLMYGLIVAFTISSSWERFSKIRDAVAEETSSLFNVFLLLKSFAEKNVAEKFSKQVENYCSLVVQTDWKDYWKSEKVHKAFQKIFPILFEVKIKNERDAVLYEDVLEEFREASMAREKQLVLSQTRISKLQWIFIIMLSIVLVVSISLLSLPFNYTNLFISVIMIASILYALLILYELDSLSISEEEMSNEPYRKVIREMK